MCRSAGATSRCTSPTRGRSRGASPSTTACGIRSSYNSYTEDDKIASFVPALFNPALGTDPCNGLLIPPGTNWCQQAGAVGGTDGTEPLADGPGQQQHRAAPGHRLGRPRQRQDGGARRLRPVLPARTSESGLADRRQPAVRHERSAASERSTPPRSRAKVASARPAAPRARAAKST